MAKTQRLPAPIGFKELLEHFGGNIQQVIFYQEWLKVGLNGTQAWINTHPGTPRTSARVLATVMLQRIGKEKIAAAYGLTVHKYFQQMYDGIEAMQYNKKLGKYEPDHRTRDSYHSKLGKLLGVEVENPGVAVQVNNEKVLVMPAELSEKYEISSNAVDSSQG